MYSFQKETTISKLNQFINRQVSIGFLKPNTDFPCQSFDWEYDDERENLVLFDQTNKTEYRTYIPLADIVEIIYLDEDIYRDVVDIVTNDGNIFSICLMEEKQLCDKCGKHLNNGIPWNVDCKAGYGSRFDGDTVHRQYCDDCLIEIFDLEVISNFS